jgi:hypothetical protein
VLEEKRAEASKACLPAVAHSAPNRIVAMRRRLATGLPYFPHSA